MSSSFILDYLMLAWVLLLLFILGTMFGSWLNVCIYRLPMEKSVFWPGSRCSNCLQPIHFYDNIPLLSYLLLRGRCRSCGTTFSMRYFFIELMTGLSFPALFYVEVILNIHGFPRLGNQQARMAALFFPSPEAWGIFAHHALLVSILIVASFCDLDHREIPLSVTIPGTILGLLMATLFPWPWPWAPQEAVAKMPAGVSWWLVEPHLGPREGLYPWPFWGPLPTMFAPGGNWQTGLVTGLAGAALGTLLLRAVRFLFGLGLGMEALGLGDADLMMMAGSFIGWQPVVVAFFVGVFIGLGFGIGQIVFRGDNSLPFGPSLALGTIVTFLCWPWIGPVVQPLFFNGWLMVILAVIFGVLMLVTSYVLRLRRLIRL
jgi:leader peptidase (prepilin peptidase)/N-methyltransferase